MNPLDFFNFVKSVFTWEPEQVAALAVGVFVGMIGLFTVYRLLGRTLPWRDSEIRRDLELTKTSERFLLKTLSERDKEKAVLTGKIDELSSACETIQEANADLQEDKESLESTLRQIREERKKLIVKANSIISEKNQQISQLSQQVRSVLEQQGRFWERRPQGTIPPFRPRDQQRPPIIALVNLKGGVGKTTLTANLGSTLWTRGQRVLLVDLDNQGSLTGLCLPPSELTNIRKGKGRLVHHLFQDHGAPGETAWNLRTRIGDSEGYLMGAWEQLAEVEEHVKAAWLMQQGCRDVRYDLRAALHDPLIQESFDAILLDCPPRLSTACINALTASDFVLVPVLLDKVSADNVPRLLKWLRLLKAENVCPDLEVLGVVANGTHNKKKLTMKEKDLLDRLAGNCQEALAETVYMFQRFIPASVKFANSAEDRTFAALDDDLRPLFLDLLTELQERISTHASSRPAKIRA